MRTYEYMGDLQTQSNVYKCPECGSLTAVHDIPLHDAYHARVDGMFHALEHLMEMAKRLEQKEMH